MKNEFWTAIYFDISEKEYENGDYISGFCERQKQKMQNGFSVQNYYHDCLEVVITEIFEDTFYYEYEYFSDLEKDWKTVKRYVIILGYEEGAEEWHQKNYASKKKMSNQEIFEMLIENITNNKSEGGGNTARSEKRKTRWTLTPTKAKRTTGNKNMIGI